jgi:membrane protease YdiL (CAAX protease family)
MEGLLLLSLHSLFGIDNIQKFFTSPETQAHNIRASLFIQGLSSVIMFFLPAAMFSVLISGRVWPTLKMNVSAPFIFFVVGIVAIFASGVAAPFLTEINSKIPLPQVLKPWVENQAADDKLLEVFFAGKTILHFLALTVVLCLLPAIGEEVLFRGVLQKELSQTSVGNYGAIILAAMLFSVGHIEFNNFIARWLMGIVLGMLFFSSQSLWVSIAAHFFNNFIIVLFKYLYTAGIVKIDLAEVTPPVYITLLSLIVLAACMYALWKLRVKPAVDDESEEINQPL